MKPGPAVAQQLGPIGVNIGKVISDVNQATQEFKGMKVPVELDIDEKTKDFIVITSSPPTSELIKKELNLEKGSAKHAEIKMGNASIEDIIKIAKVKHPNMLEKDLKAAIRSVLGTCASVGILVENENPNELIHKINDGKFAEEIEKELTETSPEKRQKMEKQFKVVAEAQEAKIEAEKKEAEEEAAKAAEAAEAGEVPAEGEAEPGEALAEPAEGAEETPKEEEKKE